MKATAVFAAAMLISATLLVNGELDRRASSPFAPIISGDYRCTIQSAGKTTHMVMITALTDQYLVIEGEDLETTIPTITLVPRDTVTEVWCLEEKRRAAMVQAISASGLLHDRDGVDLSQFAPDPSEAAQMRELVRDMERRVRGE